MKEINYVKYTVLGYFLATIWNMNDHLYFGLYFLFVCINLFLDVVLLPKYKRVKMPMQGLITAKKICKIYTIILFDGKCENLDNSLRKYLLKNLDEVFSYVAMYQLKDGLTVASLWQHLQELCLKEVKDGEY